MSDSRRANPPGWVPPKAPYNPYDPTDSRPPQGYPSEFQTPGKQRSWTLRPKEPENYRVVKDQLKRLQYTPRPLSDLYPGQYKVLRRTDTGAFNAGIRYASLFLGTGLVFFGVFFYRWNDGYENVFSVPYRFQLQIRESLFNNLSELQKEDLYNPKQRGISRSGSALHVSSDDKDSSSSSSPSSSRLDKKDEITLVTGNNEGDGTTTLQRPQRMHYIEAERIRQEREEAILRAVDIAEEQLKTQNSSSTGSISGSSNNDGGNKKSSWKFW